MKIELTEKEKLVLEARHRSERDKHVCDRIKAVLLRAEGWTVARIAQALRVNKDTIRRYLHAYIEEKKLSHANGGSSSHLDEKQTWELVRHLESTTYDKVLDICAYVEATYCARYAISGMTCWLKKYNFVYKKPKFVPAKADEAKQLEFIATYEALKEKASNKEPIFFIDSVHPTMEVKKSCGWIRKGQEKQIMTTASRTRLNITGAIRLETMDVIHHDYKTINAETTIDFMKKMKASCHDSAILHIILDCYGYHKSKDVENYAKDNGIILHFLPPYSPNLNPIERLWKVMNEKVRNNRYFHSAKEFKTSILEFFTHKILDMKKALKIMINDNFHIVKIADSS